MRNSNVLDKAACRILGLASLLLWTSIFYSNMLRPERRQVARKAAEMRHASYDTSVCIMDNSQVLVLRPQCHRGAWLLLGLLADEYLWLVLSCVLPFRALCSQADSKSNLGTAIASV